MTPAAPTGWFWQSEGPPPNGLADAMFIDGMTGWAVGTVGTIVHSLALMYIVLTLDWDAEIERARERERLYSARRLKSTPSEALLNAARVARKYDATV